MSVRHKWDRSSPCGRCGKVCAAVFPESDSGKPCETTRCLTCRLHRRRERFVRDEQSAAKVRMSHRDVDTLYFTASRWTTSLHVPMCTPAKPYPVPPVERKASDLSADDWAAMGWQHESLDDAIAADRADDFDAFDEEVIDR